MKTNIKEAEKNALSPVLQPLAVRNLAKAALAGPIVCNPMAVVRTDIVAPSLIQFEEQEAARKLREYEEFLRREQEAQRFTSD